MPWKQHGVSSLTPLHVHGSGAERNALLAAIRREVEATEERISLRMGRFERQTDMLREASEKVTRCEERLSCAEDACLESSRAHAQISGRLRGFADELQALVRRVANFDARIGAASQPEQPEARIEQAETRGMATLHGLATVREDILKQLDSKIQGLSSAMEKLNEPQQCYNSRLDIVEIQLEHLVEDCKSVRLESRAAVEVSKTASLTVDRLTKKAAQEVPQEMLRQTEHGLTEARTAAKVAVDSVHRFAENLHEHTLRLQSQEVKYAAMAQQVEAHGACLRDFSNHVSVEPQQCHNEIVERPLQQEPRREHSKRNPVDRRINALEEKLAARSKATLESGAPSERGSHEQLPSLRQGLSQTTPAASSGDSAGLLDGLRTEVSELTGRVNTHSMMLEDVNLQVLAVKRLATKAEERAAVLGSHQAAGVVCQYATHVPRTRPPLEPCSEAGSSCTRKEQKDLQPRKVVSCWQWWG